MAIADNNEYHLSSVLKLDKYQSIGIGPGIDTKEETQKMLHSMLSDSRIPIILDADALNLLSKDISILMAANGKAILTPHPKEFNDCLVNHPMISAGLNY
jgi:NAD(P)H-hydrate epimerase